MASVFAAAVLTAIPTRGGQVLDLCAAPGGKSLLARHLLQPDQLWCNEVVRKRVRILIANLKRCGATEAVVFNLDPEVWAEQAPQGATVVLVDAPCSGQSLLAKGDSALGCFHPQLINRNAGRQRRILAAAAAILAPGGYLAYMTCTFSPEENERVGAWLLRTFPQLQAIAVPLLEDYQSSLGDFPCYRLWPQSGLGAGAFTVLFQKQAPRSTPEGCTTVPGFLERYGWPIHPPDIERQLTWPVKD
jgi:16S rRNA C967 or C1407 C5-methylase (RsmB/RsmF family)